MTPIDAQLARGWELQQQGQFAAAEQVYRQVLQVAPQDANAWCYLGIACHDQGRYDEAVAAYRQAIQLRPSFPIAFNNLGNTLRMQRRLPEAVASFDQALRLQPDYVTAHKNKGTALIWEGFVDEAVACYQRALQLDPEDAESHKNLGVAWLLQGKFEQGWREYEWRWKTPGCVLPQLAQPLWDGSSLAGRTILLTAEQGLGDTLHFIRYAAELKRRFACRVIAACQRVLWPLLQSCPGIDQLIAPGELPPPCDVFAPLLSLPGILGETTETFPNQVPYLAPEKRLVEKWRQELAQYGGFKIGIGWQGNRQHQADHMRSIPLREFLPLGKLKGIQLFSLQKGYGTEQLEALQGRLDVVPLGERLDEQGGAFLDTAAVLQSLDLVITSDTSLAHLAGALGVPTWLVLYRVPDWRWLLAGEGTRWYPTLRLFRQPQPGDWASVFQTLAAELLQLSPSIQPKGYADFRAASSGMNRLVSGRHGWLLYNRHDLYVGRALERYGEFSEGEVDVFRQLIRPGYLVLEAGANVGAHTLALSELVGDKGLVLAFEPQRVVFQTLCANLALNSRTNVSCRCEALADAPGRLLVPLLDYHSESNFGGLALGEYQVGEPVPAVTIDSLNLPRCDFLKVDVEGMELAVLQGAAETLRKFRPVVYVENDRPENSPALIEYLLAAGYELYWHLPPLFDAGNYFGNSTNEFPGLVSSNMLGVHSSFKSSINGLRRIQSPQDSWRSQ